MYFEWNGKRFTTYSEIIEYCLGLQPEEQKKFVEAFSLSSPYALENVGYVSGYYEPTTAKRILQIFGTSHPIFGKRTPTPKEAHSMGYDAGKASLKDL